MSYPVTYHCPRCGTLVELDREGYLADKSVTPYPLEGWTYVAPDEEYEADDADGVRFVCGEEGRLAEHPTAAGENGQPPDHDGDVGPDFDDGCGEAFYLSFVRFEDGREIDPRPESEFVAIDPDPRPSGPRGPSGPGGGGGSSGPGGPGGGSGGFWS